MKVTIEFYFSDKLQLQPRALRVWPPQILMYAFADLPFLGLTYHFIFPAIRATFRRRHLSPRPQKTQLVEESSSAVWGTQYYYTRMSRNLTRSICHAPHQPRGILLFPYTAPSARH
ncbi:hypothetical protein BJV78DRAFT_1208945 [Lactifluus subvellereus]|nr:hypothetical protein BJV78DRAFT_1208945 [Lactifluus subvellereus]